MPGCAVCPYKDHPTITGAARITGLTRYCEKIDPDHPDHDPRMRASYIRSTASLNGLPDPGLPAPPTPAAFPSLLEQAGNLAGAVGRFVASGGKLATKEEQARRLAICEGCEFFEDRKCLKCGCRTSWKARIQSEHCPLDPPKW